MKLAEKIKKEVIKSSISLSSDVEELIFNTQEENTLSCIALDKIKENIRLAKELNIPMCQDTGLFYVYVLIGRNSKCNIVQLETAINEGLKDAAVEGLFRKSIVKDPLFNRDNTKTNLPAVINYELINGEDIEINVLLKGFGSENCSSVRLLRPTDTKDDVIHAVLDIMKKAGSKPCPPVFLGLGIGATMDRAAVLSKKALFKKVNVKHENEDYAALEEEIKNEINKTEIGVLGLGGKNTCLSVKIEAEATHIAGLPIALSVNCWADRKAKIIIKGGFND